MMQGFMPLRGATRLLIALDPLKFVYRSTLRHEVSIEDDGTSKTREMMRTVWWLHTRDMSRTKMPIVIMHKTGVYSVRASSSVFTMYQSNTDMTCNFHESFQMPLTPHHLIYMIDQMCSMQKAIKDLAISDETRKLWTQKRMWIKWKTKETA